MDNNPNVSTSLWMSGIEPPRFQPLTQDTEADVAIIGGGITGITAAWILANAGQKVVVLEARSLGLGATAFSTGNLYETTGEGLHGIRTRHNSEVLAEVLASRRSAMDFIQTRAQSPSPNSGFQRVPWYYFNTATTEKSKRENAEIIQNEYEIGREMNLGATNVPPPGFPFKNVSEIVHLPDQAQINPYGYVVDLANSIPKTQCRIYENSQVVKIEDGTPCIAYTDNAKVTARHLIVATHSPKGIYLVHTGMIAHREFVVAAQLNGPLPENAIYWNLTDTEKFSVRPYSNSDGDYLVATGSPFKVGSETDIEKCLENVEAHLKANFDVQRIVYRWAAQNYQSADGLPYIGRSPLQNHTFIATGFQADGLVYGTLAAMLIADDILDKKGKWQDLYKPTRFTPLISAKQFLKENSMVVSHLIKDYLFYGEVEEVREIAPGEGKTLTINGEKLAAYRDESGDLHLVSAVCTHLGCIVHFNKVEKSWDCPCHGSRFTTRGEVIEGPAFENLSPPRERKPS